ncbi:DNA mismatch repair protein MutL [Chlamydia avium]|uniref:DNA mismatch repair protein MutL n=1 Tax=Chlamydia avium TaxID=1457141 RepID=A0ABP2X771_9CHLA|nr:DNA mismatch repair endonuclease MutL [Chlamydia avium]EPP36166.1 DNA mismatch repair MutL family protein [Chlamydia psittaci 10_743_SC13]EPP38660.1 DNA mismatch repair MutL family protein [Chlamydia avium]VVT43173.1 DNA mismatch repair protein MutL [Chlamydia avium]
MSSGNRIQLLDTVTINQIAAGEVIESAVSVVKELVENSLDAKADEIDIETLGSGQGRIVVKDNGCGMDPEDIPWAIRRHATSKIAAFSDIFSLLSFGFRGEALSAIAAVAKMEILSCSGSGRGSRTVVRGGEILTSESSPRQRGTTITVDSLFYNVPVRRGFQKSPQADHLAIRRLLENRILSMEGVGWSWISEKQQEFYIHKHWEFSERVAFVMGDSFMRSALDVGKRSGSLRISGFLGLPDFHRPTRQGQRVFINDRPVDSIFISKKVGEAYTLLLPPQRYPVFVLKLYLPSHWCDFNVHPQKTEVRLLKEDSVGEFILESIRDALARSQGNSICSSHSVPTFPETNQKQELRFVEDIRNVSLPQNAFVNDSMLPKSPMLLPTQERQIHMPWGREESSVRFLTSLGKVILAEDYEGVHVVFVNAVRKHLFYLSLLGEQDCTYETQSFLIPICLEVTSQEGAFLVSHMEELKRLGIGISQMGPSLFFIDSAPTLICDEELKTWLLYLSAEGKKKIDKTTISLLIKETLAQTMFCKSRPEFDVSWLSFFWELGKPERAFDGSLMRRLIVDEDFIKERG